ncbi:hypothetical protein IT414_02605 [bacterium]|nr:hypothetical protein [bacterium]
MYRVLRAGTTDRMGKRRDWHQPIGTYYSVQHLTDLLEAHLETARRQRALAVGEQELLIFEQEQPHGLTGKKWVRIEDPRPRRLSERQRV